MLDKIIIKNILSLFSLRISNYIIPLITLPYLVRVLEPVGYGTLVFSLAIVQYFIILVNFGFDLSVTQKIAQNKNDKLKVSSIYWNVLATRLLFSFIGFIILFLSSYFSVKIAELLMILFCGYLSVFGTALFPQWLFQGKEQLGTVSLIRGGLQLSSIPFLLFFVNSPSDIWLAALISSTPSFLLVFFSSYITFKRKWIVWIIPTIEGMKEELKDAWHLFISTAAINLYTTSTTVILGVIAGPVSVAIFASANKLLQAAQGLYAPVSSSFYPRINNLILKSKLEALEMIKYLMKIQIVLTTFISLSLFIFAPFVVDLLFGSEYERSAIVLRILSLLPIVIGLSNIFGVQVLLTHGYKKEFATILMSSGIFSLTTLVPLCYLMGSEGAAISVLITEIIVTLLMLYTIKKKGIYLFKR
jgi:PST family polysaccharide transporter